MYSVSNLDRNYFEKVIKILTNYDLLEGESRQFLGLLKSLVAINYLISREDTEKGLLMEVCNILHKECGYQFTWIGFIQEGSEKIVPVAYAGFDKESSETVNMIHDFLADSAGDGINEDHGINDDGSRSLRFKFWKDPSGVKRLLSCINFPLIVDGDFYGLLIVYSSHVEGFDDIELDFLTQISESVAHALSSIRARKKCSELETSLERFEREYHCFLENTDDGVLVVKEGVINYANPRAGKLLDFKEEDLTFESFEEVIHPADRKKASKYLRDTKEKPQIFSFRTLDKNSKPRWIEVSSIPLYWVEEHTTMNFLRDITDSKVAEKEAKMRHLRFRVEEGNLYLVKEKSIINSLEVFNHLINLKYSGLIISRTPREKFKASTDGCEFWWITEREVPNSVVPVLEEIQHQMEKIFERVILIDSVEYLKFYNGFTKTLKFIQNLREISYLNEHIIIVPVDPATLNERELRLMEKETVDLERGDDSELSEEYYEILKFIYGENKWGRKPSYTDVEKAVGITKPTVRKRVRKLVNFGYLIQSTTGRSKSLELNEKSRNLLI